MTAPGENVPWPDESSWMDGGDEPRPAHSAPDAARRAAPRRRGHRLDVIRAMLGVQAVCCTVFAFYFGVIGLLLGLGARNRETGETAVLYVAGSLLSFAVAVGVTVFVIMLGRRRESDDPSGLWVAELFVGLVAAAKIWETAGTWSAEWLTAYGGPVTILVGVALLGTAVVAVTAAVTRPGR